jgi:hypothetical protein
VSIANPILRIGFLLFCLLSTPVAAKPAQTDAPALSQESVFSTNADGAIVNRASGFLFPDRLAELPRRRVRIIAANDVMVQYTQHGGGLGDCWMDVIVYPASRSLETEAADVEAQIAGRMTAASVPAPAPIPVGAADGRSNWFRGTAEGRTFTTGYVLVRRGAWFILVRASNPVEAGDAGLARLLAGIAAVDWSWRSSSAAVSAEMAEEAS